MTELNPLLEYAVNRFDDLRLVLGVVSSLAGVVTVLFIIRIVAISSLYAGSKEETKEVKTPMSYEDRFMLIMVAICAFTAFVYLAVPSTHEAKVLLGVLPGV